MLAGVWSWMVTMLSSGVSMGWGVEVRAPERVDIRLTCVRRHSNIYCRRYLNAVTEGFLGNVSRYGRCP